MAAYASEDDWSDAAYDEDASDDDFDVEEDFDPAPKKAAKGGKKAAGGGAKKKAALAEVSSNTAPKSSKGGRGGKKTIEQIYQKKTQLEHILLRPDTYVGSMNKVTQPMHVWDDAKGAIVQRSVTFVPSLYKIYDEILVNAADNKQRDPSMDAVKVDIDQEEGSISVWNNGRGIPVTMHKEHGVYVPELIFGHLLTSSNYDDSERKVTGGRNGYGAKLANIFSDEFTVETVDSERGLHYRQVFRDNMQDKGEPEITELKGGKQKKKKARSPGQDFTRITFKPDLKRFKMDKLDDDTVALLKKRAYDIAGATHKSVSVHLNGTKIDVNDFKSYVDLYIQDDEAPRLFENCGDRWEICVSLSDGQFEQISFVNSICTYKGGQHVSHVVDQIAQEVCKVANKKNKGVKVKPHHVRNHMRVFVNCLIENPTFDSQTKENMTLRPQYFGSQAELAAKYVKSVVKCGLVDRVLSWAKFKQVSELKRKGGAKKQTVLGIPKLDDANLAGGAKGEQCTLILTEGDSAKALAVSGLSVVGRDRFGVFPLKGKPLNVREATHQQILKNAEIQNVVKIMGLQFGKEYTSAKGLRYGHLLIMADQDHDGSHIKGLIINLIHHFWPSLLRVPGFLQQFITPIVKCRKGGKSLSFYTMPEYEAWREQTNGGKGWSIKYYKGLGTSNSQEAKEYFRDLDAHVIDFVLDDEKEKDGAKGGAAAMSDSDEDEDEDDDWEGAGRAAASGAGADSKSAPKAKASSEDLIDLAFSKKRADDRKAWLQAYQHGTHVDYAVEAMKISDFVNRELILFSRADNVRSVPSAIDGLKPSQRKVLFACFKRNLRKEIKVAQLAGYVSEQSAYHHGEASLAATITGMAQSFVGSNNINLLVPSGQFGTRLMGGKDAASPRYIFTKLHAIARLLFHPDDDALLAYQEEDGQTIEPEHYVPVLPLALVNGADGIGTGWSTFVPNYNPRDVIAALRDLLAGRQPKQLRPWYRGFSGEVIGKAPKGSGRGAGRAVAAVPMSDDGGAAAGPVAAAQEPEPTTFILRGKAELNDKGDRLVVSELPVRRWTSDYKQFLEELTPQAEKEREKGKPKGKKGAKGKGAAAKKKATAKGKGKGKGKKGAQADMEDDEDEDFDDSKSVASTTSTVAESTSTALVKELKEGHTDTTVLFDLGLTPFAQRALRTKSEIIKTFRLDAQVSVGNMHLFDRDGRIAKYKSPLDLLREFFVVRMELYGKRKAHILSVLREEQRMLRAKARFITEVVEGSLVVSKRPKAELVEDLAERGYPECEPSKIKQMRSGAHQPAKQTDDEEEEDDGNKASGTVSRTGYNYLLGMPLWNLTLEKVQELRAEVDAKDQEVIELESTAPEQLYMRDLDALEGGLTEMDGEMADAEADEAKARRSYQKQAGKGKKGKAGGRKGALKRAQAKAGAKKAVKKAKRAADDDDEDEFDSDASVDELELELASDGEDSDFDEEDFAPAPSRSRSKGARAAPRRGGGRAAAKKAAAKVSAVATPMEDDGDSDGDSEAQSRPAALPAKSKQTAASKGKGKAAARVAVQAASPVPQARPTTADDSDSDSDSDEEEPPIETMSLAARLAMRTGGSSSSSASASKASSSSSSSSSKAASSSAAAAPKSKSKPKKAATKKAKKAAPVWEDSDDEDDLEADDFSLDEDDDDFEPAPKARGKGGKAGAKATASRRKQAKGAGTKQAGAGAGRRKGGLAGIKRPTIQARRESLLDDDDDMSAMASPGVAMDAVVSPKKPPAKKSRAAAGGKKKGGSKAAASKGKAKGGKKTGKGGSSRARKSYDSDAEEDSDEGESFGVGSEEDELEVAPKPRARASRRAAAATRAKFVELSDESGSEDGADSDDGEAEWDDGDDSDF